jgi:hypothetical protein
MLSTKDSQKIEATKNNPGMVLGWEYNFSNTFYHHSYL